MKPLIIVSLLVASFSLNAADDAAQKKEDILRFFRIMSVGEIAIADMKKNSELQSAANPQIPPGFWPELFEELTPKRLEEHMVPIYDENYTHDEIKAWIVFFESDAGQAFVQKKRMVLEQSMQSGQELVREIGAPIMQRLQSDSRIEDE